MVKRTSPPCLQQAPCSLYKLPVKMDDSEGPRPWAEALFAWMHRAREEFAACPAPLRNRIIDMALATNFNTRPCVPVRPCVPAGDAEPSESSVAVAADAAEVEADAVPETEWSDKGSSDGDAEARPTPEVWVSETPPLPQEGDELGVPCSLGDRGADDTSDASDTSAASAAAEPQMAAPAQAQAQAPAPAPAPAPAEAGPSRTAAAPRRPRSGRHKETWAGLQALAFAKNDRGLRAQAVQRRRDRAPAADVKKMVQAAAKVDPYCRFCHTVAGTVIDHKVPILHTPCPAYEAAGTKAREQMAKEGTRLTFLCDPCHSDKTAADTELAWAMTRFTLVLRLLPLDENKPFTLEELRLQYDAAKMQRILRDAWFHDRLIDDDLLIYDFGEQGMPHYKCTTCHTVGETSAFSFGLDMRGSLCDSEVRAMILLPQCPVKGCRKATRQIVCKRTDRPHFTGDSIATQLKYFGRRIWPRPDSPAQVQEWRARLASGRVWFDWPDYDMATKSYRCLSSTL